MKTLGAALCVVVLSCGWTNVQADRSHPLEQLPEHMRVLVDWGQRPEFSPDGRYVYFLAKAWSNVFRIEVATGRIEPVTLHFWHEGFQRVLCLPTGDLLLLGSRQFDATNPDANRHRLEMSVLQKPFDRPPVSLGHFCDEGPAIDRSKARIAWTEPGQRVIRVAEIVDLAGQPRLVGVRTIVDQDAGGVPETHRLETQDFWPGTNKLLFTLYHGTREEPFYFANVAAVDLVSGEVSMVTDLPETYTEAEGVAPDGSFVLVESDRENERRKWKIDVYLQPLDGRSPAIRLCTWNRFPGYRSDNPVVSPDGRTIVIQCGFMAGAGEGRGMVLFDLEAWRSGGSPTD
jgi:hypothetical protein